MQSLADEPLKGRPCVDDTQRDGPISRLCDWRRPLISLTRFHHTERIVLNPDLIERIEETPDTVVTLTNGAKYLVQESVDEIISIAEAHQARVLVLARRMLHDDQHSPPTGRLRLLRGHLVDDVDEMASGPAGMDHP